MQSADDMKFRDRLAVSGRSGLECLFQRHGVGAGRVFLSAKGAQTARRHAHIRGIDVAIDVEVGLVAMHTLADGIGHPAHGKNVAGAIQGKGVVDIQALAGHDFVMDGRQARIVSLKGVSLESLV